MVDFLKYVFSEVKSKRLSQEDALEVMRQFYEGGAQGGMVRSVLHPMLHTNTSDLAGPQFSTVLSGDEFFLAQADEQGRKALPPLAYLEMALAALRQVGGPAASDAIRLRHVAWGRPLVLGAGPAHLHIGLYPEEDGRVAFEIFGDAPTDDGEAPVYGQGIGAPGATAQPGRLDIAAALAQFPEPLMLRDRGEREVLESLHGGPQQVVAKLVLPSGADDDYALHPSMMGGVLHAALALLERGAGQRRSFVPFALDSLDLMGTCPGSMWAVVRYSAGSAAADRVPKLDIDLCDDDGAIRVRMQGLSVRELDADLPEHGSGTEQSAPTVAAPAAPAASAPRAAQFAFAPVWDATAVRRVDTWPAASERVVVVGGTAQQQDVLFARYPAASLVHLPQHAEYGAVRAAFEEHGPVDHIVWIAPAAAASADGDGLVAAQQHGVLACLRLVKSLLELGYGARPLGWTFITEGTQAVLRQDQVAPAHASVYGFVGSMASEYPNWKLRLADLQPDAPWPCAELFALPADPLGNAWAWRQGQWYRQQLLAAEVGAAGPGRYKQGGVYVVIGGAGGIGEVWSEYMVRTYGAHIVWIGRRVRDAAIDAKLEGLAALGPAPHYIAADAGDRASLQAAYDEIRQRHGRVDGVVHAAIVLADRSLAQIDEAQFKSALSAKVDVSVRLAQVFGAEALDFVLFFSSEQYGFKDAFAQQLRQSLSCPVKLLYAQDPESLASQERQLAVASFLDAPLERLVFGGTGAAAMAQADVAESLRVYAPCSPPLLRALRIHGSASGAALLAHAVGAPQRDLKEELESHLCHLLYGQLRATGLFADASFTVEEAKARIGFASRLGRWLDESLRVLAQRGYLVYDGQLCALNDAGVPPIEQAWAQWEARKSAWLADPHVSAQVAVAEVSLRALPAVLTGSERMTDVLFPDSSMALVEGVYKNNPVSDYFNGALADVVVAYVEERLRKDATARIRILEIGAGTGGTSALLFERLKPYQAHMEEYCYTDLSRAFLWHAEKSYGPENPYLKYQIFDVSKPLSGQGVQADTYDLVVATNVLHATPVIRQTLRNAKASLRANGLLLVNEISENQLFAQVTFGLLDGWWLYEDEQLRIPGCPGLYPAAWQAVLEEEGFRAVTFPAQSAHLLGQQIIVAESDGVARQAAQSRDPSSQSRQRPAAVGAQADGRGSAPSDAYLVDKVKAMLSRLVSRLLKVKPEDVNGDTELSEFGFDSISLTQFGNALNTEYEIALAPTIFFEYPTLNTLAGYLASEYRDLFAARFATVGRAAPVSARQEETVQRSIETGSRRKRFARSTVQAPDAVSTEPIAIVGMSGCFPMARDADAFWTNLVSGRDCMSEIPRDRWDWEAYYDELPTAVNKTNVKWGGFMDSVADFDAAFFGISPREAELMDPQQRLLMTHVWKAIEDAGYSAASFSGTDTALFIGTAPSGYGDLVAQANVAVGGYVLTGAIASVGPNRMSYLLNLRGPSEPIETACSSSLVALRRGVRAIQSGESEMAIVGGVHTLVTPAGYVVLGKSGMLSPDGRCKTFSDRADGFARGEGVGILMLKKLSAAEQAGDHIYGVIRGTAENHGGRANSLTAPNPKAQAALLVDAYTQAGIDPRSIGYIEAHGTGTALGDPIEINGLKSAFKTLYQAGGNAEAVDVHCGLGTVKSNIGHLELAAGIAGVMKVLLQLKHKTLVKTLHCDTLNPYIDLKDSPFYVVQENRTWDAPRDAQGNALPRRAGVSSFGFGGVNAHVVIEEYVPKQRAESAAITPERPALVVLSAKNAERLREQVRQLLAWIDRESPSPVALADMAYTLQVGREAMEERLAVIAGSAETLVAKLFAFLAGDEHAEDLYRGNAKRNTDAFAALADVDMSGTINAWLDEGNYDKLLGLWVKGLSFDWQTLYGAARPKRLSLPTYPFSGERYWVPQAPAGATGMATEGMAVLHPLLHRNTSDLSEQRFTTTLSGQEFFLADHLVRGRKTLPGAVALEMAHLALQQAAKSGPFQLEQVEWTQPIVVDDAPRQVHIGLYPLADGTINYEIFGDVSDGESVLYGKGVGVARPAAGPDRVDIAAVQAECRQSLQAGECYAACEREGVSHGARLRSLQSVGIGTAQALARLVLPSDAQSAQVLLSSQTEAAMVASMALLDSVDGAAGSLPAALESLELLGECTASMWAVVRRARDGRLDIDLCTDDGSVRVRMRGLQMQAAPEHVPAARPQAAAARPESPLPVRTAEAMELLTFEEAWEARDAQAPGAGPISTVVCFASDALNRQAISDAVARLSPATRLVFIGRDGQEGAAGTPVYSVAGADGGSYVSALAEIKKEYGDVDAMFYLWPLEDRACIQDYSPLVHILQALGATGLRSRRLLLAAECAGPLDRCHAESWIGFERSLSLVLPHTAVASVFASDAVSAPEPDIARWIGRLWTELAADGPCESAWYRDGVRHACRIHETACAPAEGLLKPGATYLITGGLGGLGYLFAEHLVKTYAAKLILTGRAPLDAARESKLRSLEELGGQVAYLQADVTDQAAMREGIALAAMRLGPVNGLIHAAGLMSRNALMECGTAEFHRVLEPKIQGTLVLEEVLGGQPLDFVCYFSSSSAILGDFGGCHYAIANRFLMAYANERSERDCPGKTVVVNWPLWQEGGMTIGSDEHTEMYLKSSGQRTLGSAEGIALFERLLPQPQRQHLVLAAQRSRAQRFLGMTQAPAPAPAAAARPLCKGRRPEMRGFSLTQCVEWDLKRHVGEVLKLPLEKLDTTENLVEYGFDSISLVEFASALSSYYGIDITPALIFSYPSLDKLSGHFVQAFSGTLQDFYLEVSGPAAPAPSWTAPPLAARPGAPKRARFAPRPAAAAVDEPIAIIGMSGRFPDARSIDELWEILAEGRHVVHRAPSGRPGGWEEVPYRAGFVPGVSEFDPLFFEISPREAQEMDPRQRLLLQEAWRALEHAAYGPNQLGAGKLGMFVGVEEGDYQILTQGQAGLTSSHNGVLASRLAYFLNATGPVMAINTACSSGLVAAHQACLSLRNGECDTAIAAGVALMLTQYGWRGMEQAGMLSTDGTCYAFDERANGMVPAEAVTAVVLKRLSQAEADGDPIYGVIRGSGINYDGRTNGIAAPSGIAQTSLIKSVYDRYGIDPSLIDYVVAHGTGTKLGDPIEVNALRDAFRQYTDKQAYCGLISTKTHVGHTMAASGLVNLISLVQALRHEVMPPSLHCERENSYINWADSPFYVNKVPVSWPGREGGKRLGAVSAFGMSGTNAHMVVQSYVRTTSTPRALPCYLFAFSAKSEAALIERMNDILAFMQDEKSDTRDLAAISYTLLEGRHHFSHRCAFIAQDRENAINLLQQAVDGHTLPNLFRGKVSRSFKPQKLMQTYVQDLLEQSVSQSNQRDKYQEVLLTLADSYCQGYSLEWTQLYGEEKPKRIGLPTYPFAQDHYWVDKASDAPLFAADAPGREVALHPLLHRNTSDLTEQRFSSRFSGAEFSWPIMPCAAGRSCRASPAWRWRTRHCGRLPNRVGSCSRTWRGPGRSRQGKRTPCTSACILSTTTRSLTRSIAMRRRKDGSCTAAGLPCRAPAPRRAGSISRRCRPSVHRHAAGRNATRCSSSTGSSMDRISGPCSGSISARSWRSHTSRCRRVWKGSTASIQV
jgi:acyl transferase domain-containing protein/acyl carrier protein/SAM-dependent methyltransferase